MINCIWRHNIRLRTIYHRGQYMKMRDAINSHPRHRLTTYNSKLLNISCKQREYVS